MKLSDYRDRLNQIDEELVSLFEKRMTISREIAALKSDTGQPVADRGRERAILARVTDRLPAELQNYGGILYSTIFDLSRSYQLSQMKLEGPLSKAIEKAMSEMPEAFPTKATVACQGIEGAYSQQAADRLFPLPSILYFQQFEGVFRAVEQGLCKYGILPIENSLHGSVTEVYDLMKKYAFFIARSLKLRVRHVLLGQTGAKLSELTEIFSHEQALGQCGEFLKPLGNVKVTVCENTAAAARMVAQSGRDDWAALSSCECAALYRLSILSDDVQDNDSNYTRFICISKNLEIYRGSNRISLMLSVPHRPGSLYRLISRISSQGININKLESRPIPGSDFEFMFYFDLETSVGEQNILSLLSELSSETERFTFLGNYSEA
jgi:chorismate mutase/prephenate dehydratase